VFERSNENPSEKRVGWGNRERITIMALSTTKQKVKGVQATPAPKRQGRRWSRYSSRTFYLFVSPWIVGFLLLTLIPLLYALGLSFTDWDGISPHWHIIGLANYINIFQDSEALGSLARTLLYTAITVPLSIAGGLGLAIMLNQRLKASGFFRTIFYVPSLVPVVATAIMWKLIFDRDAGALNAVLEVLHIPAITWLADPTAFYALIILMLWGLGGGMVITLAGLQGIPSELSEAAVVDGASPWQVFLNITLPMLSPVLFFQAVTGVITALQILVQPLLLSQTNSISQVTQIPHSNLLYVVYVYQQFTNMQHLGYGAALLWVFFVVILLITLVVLRSGRFWVYYEVDGDK
jgi:multiple sugar transport system permease protein